MSDLNVRLLTQIEDLHAEIERLRGLLREAVDYIAFEPNPFDLPRALEIKKRVRIELGQRPKEPVTAHQPPDLYDRLLAAKAEGEASARATPQPSACATCGRTWACRCGRATDPTPQPDAAREVTWKWGDAKGINDHIEFCSECHFSRSWIGDNGHGANCSHRAAEPTPDAL